MIATMSRSQTVSDREICEAVYQVYPRRVGKIDAVKAIEKAIQRIQEEEKICHLEAARKLYRAARDYAKSDAGQNPERKLIPHPATWFNRGSYLDDPKEWSLQRMKEVSAHKAATLEAKKSADRERLLQFWREVKEDG